MSNFHVIIFFAFITIVSCVFENSPFQSCDYPQYSRGRSNCEIHMVKLFPCDNLLTHKACPGDNTQFHIFFEYTSNFNSPSLHGNLFRLSQEEDIPLIKGIDGCDVTTCPIESGIRRNATITWYIKRDFIETTFRIKGKLWNDENEECCFIIWLDFSHYNIRIQ